MLIVRVKWRTGAAFLCCCWQHLLPWPFVIPVCHPMQRISLDHTKRLRFVLHFVCRLSWRTLQWFTGVSARFTPTSSVRSLRCRSWPVAPLLTLIDWLGLFFFGSRGTADLHSSAQHTDATFRFRSCSGRVLYARYCKRERSCNTSLQDTRGAWRGTSTATVDLPPMWKSLYPSSGDVRHSARARSLTCTCVSALSGVRGCRVSCRVQMCAVVSRRRGLNPKTT